MFELLLQNLKTLFEVREFINGKVDMQKSLYFMKELGYLVPFGFRWSKLGPYSFELANLLDRLTLQGYMEYTGKYEMVRKSFRFVKTNVTPVMKDFFFALEKICNQNSFDQVDFIECAASLHFIHKNSHNKEKRAVFDGLASLKSDRMDAFRPLIEHAWNFLKEQKLLKD